MNKIYASDSFWGMRVNPLALLSRLSFAVTLAGLLFFSDSARAEEVYVDLEPLDSYVCVVDLESEVSLLARERRGAVRIVSFRRHIRRVRRKIAFFRRGRNSSISDENREDLLSDWRELLAGIRACRRNPVQLVDSQQDSSDTESGQGDQNSDSDSGLDMNTPGSGGNSGGLEEVFTGTACEVVTEDQLLLGRPIARIIQGEECRYDSSPIVELLMLDRFSRVVSRCSGTVVSSRGIITAAHCFGDGSSYPVTSVRIVNGNEVYSSSTFGAHPSWPADSQDLQINDVAVVVADQDLPVTPFKLLPSTSALSAGERVLIAGHGFTENLIAQGLRAGFMTLNSYDRESLIALFDGTGSNTCSGDSGGPLFVYRSGTWFLAGVTSNGDNQVCGVDGRGDVSRWARINSGSNIDFVRGFIPGVG